MSLLYHHQNSDVAARGISWANGAQEGAEMSEFTIGPAAVGVYKHRSKTMIRT
jgi:hypothetical protein